MKPLRIAVIGVGHMGALHVEKVAGLARSEGRVVLSAVVDTDSRVAGEIAKRHGVPHATDPRDVLGDADAAIVAVPTVSHFEVVRDVMQAGLDVFVEKPIAATLEEAEALLGQSREQKRILQVGHLERFNAALRRISGMVEKPRFVESHRLGPFSARSTDIDVVRDLMIHDLDIIQQLVGEEPERVEAIGVPVVTHQADIANARVVFPGGCVANVTASRVSPNAMRKLRFFQSDGYFSLDFLEQSAVVFRRLNGPDGQPEIQKETLSLDREDALQEELRAFERAVRTREAPAVSGEDALRALRTALRVVDSMPPLDS